MLLSFPAGQECRQHPKNRGHQQDAHGQCPGMPTAENGVVRDVKGEYLKRGKCEL